MGEAHGVYLGLGSNLGEREENIQKAISLIGERVGTVLRESSLIETEPWGFESENKFLNGVILVETELTPRQILNAVKAIEWDMGRRPPGKSTIYSLQSKSKVKRKSNSRYTDRPIDIDILLYDDLTIDEPDLKIPHPLMHQRDFVMIPLNEIRQ
jgi:2-amino-4-hydroxy-6-hydroxymethyldihydropteridine diphosphokinase